MKLTINQRIQLKEILRNIKGNVFLMFKVENLERKMGLTDDEMKKYVKDNKLTEEGLKIEMDFEVDKEIEIKVKNFLEDMGKKELIGLNMLDICKKFFKEEK